MNVFTSICIVVGIGFALWRITKRTRFFFHTFQLFGYKQPAYRKWIAEHFTDAWIRTSHLVGIGVLVGGWYLSLPNWALFLLWAFAFASSKRYRRDKPKKRLVWTARMKRIAGVSCALGLLAVTLIVTGAPFERWSLNLLLGLGFIDLFSPLIVSLAAVLLIPVEFRIQEGFKQEARTHLASRPDLTIVAITGSYGKTSVKFAIREILSQRFPTIATPGSFNTPMGICKVVNNDLTEEHRYAVLEMGMRHPGDIAELCNIARPNIALVTSVGPAHLEYMGSIEAIAKEKASILSFLPSDGVAILNQDDPFVREMRKGLVCRVLTVSANGDPADFFATDIEYDKDGASFLVHTGTESHSFNTKLLGRHNILNILLAVAVGSEAGLSLRQMSHAIARLEPIDHRLKLNQRGGLFVLDDAFNSNPVGAANAVEVLGAFKSERRVVVTPGMIELGEQEAALNRKFGTHIAASATDVLLVGPLRTKPIYEGLVSAGFDTKHIIVVNTLFEAQDWIQTHTQPGDAVLFENDLPDQFTEA